MRRVVLAGAAALALAGAYTAPVSHALPAPAPVPARASAAAAQSAGCTEPPAIVPTLPADMASSNQQSANCFAWQQFIALNWPASSTMCGQPESGGTFGAPNDTSPVVWETYKDASEVFLPDAKTPSGFCSPQALPAAVRAKKGAKGLQPTSRFGYKSLTMPTKFAANLPLELSAFTEAGTGGAWLTAQSTLLTMYEVRLNEDEFEYIYNNRLYDAEAQAAFAAKNGIQLPDQTTGATGIGSIEVKAAWTELDDSSLWPKFKISKAVVTYPGQEPKVATMGLVGLHIIHKTSLGQQFIWATFEHVNNAPSTTDIGNGTLKPWYTFYNANCNPMTDHYQCQPNKQPKPGPGGDPYNAPVQVERLNPIDTTSSNNIAGLNQYVWNQISQTNPQSVFLNYQLVNVLWPNNNTAISGPTAIPLTQGDPQPQPTQAGGVENVANTTLETYFQSSAACLDCHASAPIASTARKKSIAIVKPAGARTGGAAQAGTTSTAGATTTTTVLAADYSFLLSRARVSEDGGVPLAGVGIGVGVAALAAVGTAVGVRRGRRT